MADASVTMEAEQRIKLERMRQRVEAADADMSGYTFADVSLSGATFNDVNLSGAKISGTNLSGCRLQDVNPLIFPGQASATRILRAHPLSIV